jgi:hypothetical protein
VIGDTIKYKFQRLREPIIHKANFCQDRLRRDHKSCLIQPMIILQHIINYF